MKVTLIQQTKDPVNTIAQIASICYDSEPKSPEAMVKRLYLNGHHSPFEHIWFTFKIEGISRACSHQMVRHRLAAITQRSQRYVDEDGFESILPPGLNDAALDTYISVIGKIRKGYNELVHSCGVRKEDARFLLPNACTTEMYFSCNLRELMHIANERLCSRAQWEIRNVVKSMVELVDESIRWMLVPKCESGYVICHSPCDDRKHKEDKES